MFFLICLSSLPPSLPQAIRPVLLRFPLQTFVANTLGSLLSALLAVLVPMATARGRREAAHVMEAVR